MVLTQLQAKPSIQSCSAVVTKKQKARTECEQGRKWVVENHEGKQDIIIDQTNPKQTLYIYKCSNCTVQVRLSTAVRNFI